MTLGKARLGSMDLNVSNNSWRIQHNCPQCGAPVELEETDRIFTCPFCRVRLCIWAGERAEYYIAPGKSPAEELLYVPYARFKGLAFSAKQGKTVGRIVDTSLLALEKASFPATLGLRPQVLKLRYVIPGVPGRFLKPNASAGFSAVLDRCDPTSLMPGRETFIGETSSFIYAPFYLRDGMLHDAVLDRPFRASPEVSLDLVPESGLRTSEPFSETDAVSRLSFFAAICPDCGWDLQGERETFALHCTNCNSLWQIMNTELKRIDCRFMATDAEASVCLPFWQVTPTARIGDLDLRSRADLMRFINLPRIIPRAWESEPMSFLVPAFKTQPNLFLRLARTFTSTGEALDLEEKPASTNLYPTSLPLSEAVESFGFFLESIASARPHRFPALPVAEVELKDHLLVYMPFSTRGDELFQPKFKTGVQRSALVWGRLI
jgi:hypothetical protein